MRSLTPLGGLLADLLLSLSLLKSCNTFMCGKSICTTDSEYHFCTTKSKTWVQNIAQMNVLCHTTCTRRAHMRVLPLSQNIAKWIEMSAAMQCDTSHPELDEEVAEAFRLRGNQAYKEGDYTKACELYTKAISSNPGIASYYGDRSACLLMLEKYQKALEDAVRSIALDEGFVKGYLRAAKCHLMLGNPSLSVDCYRNVLERAPGNSQLENLECILRDLVTENIDLQSMNQTKERELAEAQQQLREKEEQLRSSEALVADLKLQQTKVSI